MFVILGIFRQKINSEGYNEKVNVIHIFFQYNSCVGFRCFQNK